MKKMQLYGSMFKAGEVTLTDGIFKTSRDTGLEFVKSFDVDRLLAPVAYSAGASANTLSYYGGWEAYNYRGYAGKGISGHSLGHWMSAAAGMYAAAGGAEVKKMLNYAVEKLAEYQEISGGFIGGFNKAGFEKALAGTLSVSAFDLNGYWVPWYSMHKIYQGLIDAYRLAENETALDVVCKFADWAVRVTEDMDDDKFNRMLECEYGGMNEVMAELYGITGDRKYYDLGIRFSQPSILKPLADGIDELQGKHANTQIPKVIGAAAMYDEDESLTDYRAAAEFFYDTVVNRRSYVIGGNSNYEHFGAAGDEVFGTQTCETCNTYNMMKLTEYLYEWNHKAEYMDYYERALFNHILASQEPDTGNKTYFMATKRGHFKVYSTLENSFWCCVGSGMENPARYARNIYYKDGNEFYVNQFISSAVEWNGLKISQTTNYPYEERTVIKIERGCADAAFKIRIPSWIDSAAAVKVNDGDAVSVSKTGYYAIERTWRAGDTVEVTLPMGLHTYTARGGANDAAFMYGPVVLAGRLGTGGFPTSDFVSDHASLDGAAGIDVPDLVVADKNPNTFIQVSDLSKLEFTLTAAPEPITLIPYFDLHHERYALYWRLYGAGEEIIKDDFAAELDAATVDTVRAGEQQPEVDHAMKCRNSNTGYSAALSRGWRDARGVGGCFSYDMSVDADKTNYVMAMYWAGDGDFTDGGVSYTREFEILADGAVIAEQTLRGGAAFEPIYAYYAVPAAITAGKERITVAFRTKGENTAAGGVFEVRITTAEVQPK
ncbi:MAG: glycoside hydrolase family 127 protein [Firmicutes bacterium]|nr:glycoside hydrolase family 127 protein [Bacillota bacterium]